jgi:prepilin-type N-terminal cleavage/methylation domain-containing protein
MQRFLARTRGFTLIELIIVIAIIAIIVAAVFVAIDPVRRLNAGRNARRNEDVTSIAQGIQLFKADVVTDGGTVSSTTFTDNNASTWEQIGNGTNCTIAANSTCGAITTGTTCRNLGTVSITAGSNTYKLVPNYVKAIPKDPSGGTDAATKYVINEVAGTVIVHACGAEADGPGGSGTAPTIEASR